MQRNSQWNWHSFVEKHINEAVSNTWLQVCSQDYFHNFKWSTKKLCVEIVRSYITQRIDFHKVVFTEEFRFSLDGNNNFKTLVVKIQPIINWWSFKGGSLMVWPAITYTGSLLTRRVEGSLNSEKYCRLLTNDMFKGFIKGYNGIVYISTG